MNRPARGQVWIALWTGLALLTTATHAAGPKPENSVARLPPAGDHWVWVTDRLLHHSVLFDGDSGRVLGMVDGAIGTVTPKLPIHSRQRGEIYSVDVAYSRGTRGERIDFVTVYDSQSLSVVGEAVFPTMAADSNGAIGYTALLDGDRFLAIFNQFPNASVSIIDVEARRFVGEIIMTGCAGIYPAPGLRFAMLCGNGTTALVELDAEGRRAGLTHSEPFFDPVEDPVTMAAVRNGSSWIFVSFAGQIHRVDYGGASPRVEPGWSLVDDAEREAQWRIGGLQHIALHEKSARLYALMHQGGPGSHKDSGPEIWVYELAGKTRVDRYEVPNLAASFLGTLMGLESGGALGWILERVIPNDGAHSIVVSQDDAPLLFTRNANLGVVAVIDGRTGEHVRDLEEAGLAGPTLGVH